MQPVTQPVNLGIVGLGFMGATHARAAMALDNVHLAAVVEPNEKKRSGDLRDVGGNLGVAGELMDFSSVRQYARIEDALADPGIDAIDICLPTDLHAPMAIAALRAGKHVLVEKPLSLTEAAASEVVREAEKSGKILMTGHVLRFLPAYVEAARLVKSGELGPIRMSWFRRHCAKPSWGGWLTDASRSGGGIFDLLIHDVDFSIWLYGEPASMTAAGSSGLIAGTFQYAVSGPVVIEGGWHAQGPYPFAMSFTIAGEKGTLEFSSASCPLTLSRAGAESTEMVPVPETDGFEQELRYFADCVQTGRQPEKCPPSQSALAVKVALGMLEAADAKPKAK
jgi:predicted dehydrogenase